MSSSGMQRKDQAALESQIYIELTKTASLVQEQKPAAQLDPTADNPKDIQPIKVGGRGLVAPNDTPILVEFKK